MAGFIVCAACGARMKANRPRCLRCGEALTTAPGPGGVGRPISSQLPLLGGGALVWVMAMAAGVVVWRTPAADKDDVARLPQSAVAPPQSPARSPSASRSAQSAGPGGEAAAFIDLGRRAAAAFATGNFEAARVAYEQALTERPDDPETLNNLGQVLVRLGSVNDAAARFERATELSPEKWAYRFNLARAAGELGQWGRAAAEYRRAARLFPTDYATQFNLARALRENGDQQAAIPEFQKAIQLAPGEPSFHVALATSFEAVGRTTDAVAEFRRYLEMAPLAPDAPRVKAHLDALVASLAAAGPAPSQAS